MPDAALTLTEQTPVADRALRDEVRAWLSENWDNSVRRGGAGWTTTAADRAWRAKVVEARWAVPRWPAEWYGRGLTDAKARIVEREFAVVGAPGAGQDRTNLWAITALEYATPALKGRVLRGLLTGEVTGCLLYSEPGAGSDLAGVRTRADRRGSDFVINGQKVWTSGGATADFGMLIARTDWELPKHKGLSFFFIPMKQPGIEVRPLRQITDESHFNEVFLTDAVCPAENMFGPLNGGWAVLQMALAYERSAMGEGARGPRSGVKESQLSEPLIDLAREVGVLDEPIIRNELAKVISYRKLNALNSARAKAALALGTSSSIMSLGKLAMSRILHEEARLRTMILGAASLLEGPDHPRSEDANFLTLNAYFTSIGGGTDQIQRNIIGERVLGLPKEPEVDRDVPFREVRGQ